MMKKSIGMLGLVFGIGASAQAISLATIDDFEDGTVAGWSGGTARVNMSSGGPLGANDNYLSVSTTTTGGAGSRWATWNEDNSWRGDWIGAGVTGVKLWVRNFGNNDVFLRGIWWSQDSAQWVSANAVRVQAGSGWQQITLGTLEADLTLATGSDDYATTMSGVSKFMLRHNPTVSAQGESMPASLGLDRIQAVPEPGTMAALGLGLAALARRNRKK